MPPTTTPTASPTPSPQTKWEKYAGAKKPSMKRRCSVHDYRDRGIYMITMATEGRSALLGTLTGNPAVKAGDDAPRVQLSPLGQRVKDCWEAIPRFHPAVQPLKLCIMPDHIHGIVFVRERMEKHLGHVVEGFKTGTRKAARELGLLPPAVYRDAVGGTAPVAQFTGHTAPVAQFTGPGQPSRHSAAARAHGQLWETGYHDRILTHRGQLQRMMDYLDDNPRRLLVKQRHPEYFRRLGTLNVAGTPMQAMGNRFLLDKPTKIQIQCSRSLSQEEIDRKRQQIIARALDEDGILVSPCISPGEQQIATAAMTEFVPLIVLLLNGLPPFFKPKPRYLEACEEGRLLIVAPFPYQSEKIDDMRRRCLHLNHLAETICHDDCQPIQQSSRSGPVKKT